MEQEQVIKTQTYPTEVIDLPSKGLLYPEESPLRSGKVELKYMTAKEEDILTSSNLIQKGIVLDKLMDSLIVTPGVSSKDLLIGDLNAVMVASRILGYGKDYEVKLNCPACGKVVEQTVDLTSLKTLNEPEDSLTEFSLVTPVSKAEVVLRMLTRNDEFEIEKESENIKKATGVDGDSTVRLRKMIKSVNGNTSVTAIWNFVETLLVRDARFIRDYYKKINPDVDFTIEVDCECASDNKKEVRLPIGIGFFWPDA